MNDQGRNVDAIQKLRAIAVRELAQWTEKYGSIRVPIRAKHMGVAYQFIGHGSFLRGNWITFVDFLMEYMVEMLSSTWGNAEIAKPVSKRHQMVKFYQEFCRWQQRNGAVEGTVQGADVTGYVQEYFSIAWDLFVAQDNFQLPQDLLDRIKNRKNYQGAWYELYIISSLLRAGCSLEYEDERNGNTRHVELHATDARTKQVMAVEAKSRHRNGALDFRDKTQRDSVSLGIQKLIDDAMRKPTLAPYYVFIDVNFGIIGVEDFFLQYRDEICSIIDALEEKHDKGLGSPLSGYFITNNPTHYIGNELVPPGSGFDLFIEAKKPRNGKCSAEFLSRVGDGLRKHESIPTFLLYE